MGRVQTPALCNKKYSCHKQSADTENMQSNHASKQQKRKSPLILSWIEADPSVWAPHFLEQWNTYWKRDVNDDLPVGSQEFLDLVSQVDPAPLKTMEYDLWHRVMFG